jgi:hypothetical protein
MARIEPITSAVIRKAVQPRPGGSDDPVGGGTDDGEAGGPERLPSLMLTTPFARSSPRPCPSMPDNARSPRTSGQPVGLGHVPGIGGGPMTVDRRSNRRPQAFRDTPQFVFAAILKIDT